MSDVTNMWAFDTETVSESSQSKFMPAGIEKERFITKIEFVNDPANSYLLVEMEDSAKRTVNRRYFAPKIDGVIVKDQEGLKKSVNSFLKVLANLARKFNGELYVCEGTSFENLCKNVIRDIGDKYVGKELRTKVILNKKNFPVLPAYAPIWEDPTVVPDDKSALSINSIDKIHPTTENADTDTAPKATSWTA